MKARHLLTMLALACGLTLAPTPVLAQPEGPGGEAPMPGLGGDLRLTDEDGQAFVLTRQPAGVSLVFFGFTRCTQVCSPALATMQAVVQHMGMRRPPQLLFVTLDPLNDTPAAMRAYVSRFGPGIKGLTGSPAQIDDAARRYGVTTQRTAGEPDHSARLYLLGPDRQLVRVYRLQTPARQLARDIAMLQDGSPLSALRP